MMIKLYVLFLKCVMNSEVPCDSKSWNNIVSYGNKIVFQMCISIYITNLTVLASVIHHLHSYSWLKYVFRQLLTLLPIDSCQLSPLFKNGPWREKAVQPYVTAWAPRNACVPWPIDSKGQTPIPLNTTRDKFEVWVHIHSVYISAHILTLPNPVPFLCLPKSTLDEPSPPE